MENRKFSCNICQNVIYGETGYSPINGMSIAIKGESWQPGAKMEEVQYPAEAQVHICATCEQGLRTLLSQPRKAF